MFVLREVRVLYKPRTSRDTSLIKQCTCFFKEGDRTLPDECTFSCNRGKLQGAFMFISILGILISSAFAAGTVPGPVVGSGELVGGASTGVQCAPQSIDCINVQNEGKYPMEIVSISYTGTERGIVNLESVPVFDGGKLQCVFVRNRRCVPVLAPGQMAGVNLPEPPRAGRLVVVRLRAWVPPGGAPYERTENFDLGGNFLVTVFGDLTASAQDPSTGPEIRSMKLDLSSSNMANSGKGKIED